MDTNFKGLSILLHASDESGMNYNQRCVTTHFVALYLSSALDWVDLIFCNNEGVRK